MAGCDAAYGSARLIVFDFDQTITTIHVFYELKKKDAVTELGQLRLIDERDGSSPGSFAMSAVGGEQRRDELLRFFKLMRERGVCMVVCTNGLVAAVKKVLSQLDFLEFFSEVYGRGPGGKITYTAKAYDREVRGVAPTDEERQFLAKPEHCEWERKREVIDRVRQRKKLNPSEVIFVDDDSEMLKQAMSSCRTVWVAEERGMLKEHMDEMEFRTRPSRLPHFLISCLEPLVKGALRRHTQDQVKKARQRAEAAGSARAKTTYGGILGAMSRQMSD